MWTHRDPILQYTLKTTQTPSSAPFQIPSQFSKDFPLYSVQYPDLLPSPRISPRFERDYHSRRPSLAHSFGEQSFDGSLATSDSQFSTADIAGDYFPVLDISPNQELKDEDPAIIPHSEMTLRPSSLPSQRVSRHIAAPSSFQSHTHTFYAGSLPAPAPTATSPVQAMKRDHNEVERGYRNRLNDKINALAQQVFKPDESESHKRRSRPPKCLVISRAKQRLEELETQNSDLEREVESLKNKVAVLDHLLASSTEEKEPLRRG